MREIKDRVPKGKFLVVMVKGWTGPDGVGQGSHDTLSTAKAHADRIYKGAVSELKSVFVYVYDDTGYRCYERSYLHMIGM